MSINVPSVLGNALTTKQKNLIWDGNENNSRERTLVKATRQHGNSYLLPHYRTMKNVQDILNKKGVILAHN
jgi:hypothetical protein